MKQWKSGSQKYSPLPRNDLYGAANGAQSVIATVALPQFNLLPLWLKRCRGTNQKSNKLVRLAHGIRRSKALTFVEHSKNALVHKLHGEGLWSTSPEN